MKKITCFLIFSGALLFFPPLEAQTPLPPQKLTWTFSNHPDITISSNKKIHVVYNLVLNTNLEVAYKQSTDAGLTWSSAKRLTWKDGLSGFPAIDVDPNNRVHLVWTEPVGNRSIFYKRSTDEGVSWASPIRLSWTTRSSDYPVISADKDFVHVVWEDEFSSSNIELFHKYASSGGSFWSSPLRLTWNDTIDSFAEVKEDSNNIVHFVWNQAFPSQDWLHNCEIIYRQYDLRTGGLDGIRLTYNPIDSLRPDMAIDSNDVVHVVWAQCEDNGSLAEVFYKRSTNDTHVWTSSIRLTSTFWNIWYPAIAVDRADNLHLVYVRYGDDYVHHKINYKKSSDGGVTWTNPKTVAWNQSNAQDLRIATTTEWKSSGPGTPWEMKIKVHIVWAAGSVGGGATYNIYYKCIEP